VENETRVAIEPGTNVGVFVSCIVVENDVDNLADRNLRLDFIEKASRQTISDGQAEPEFQDYRRLKVERLAREARLKGEGEMSILRLAIPAFVVAAALAGASPISSLHHRESKRSSERLHQRALRPVPLRPSRRASVGIELRRTS
jgi:hypothetical protein